LNHKPQVDQKYFGTVPRQLNSQPLRITSVVTMQRIQKAALILGPKDDLETTSDIPLQVV
jgi:hypothetical protein